jgi:NAD+ synthase (glutamine-hydrolysing)
MKVALIQMNPTVGAVRENADQIAKFARAAAAAGAQMAVFPELALCGYPPDDLVLRPRFMAAVEREVERLAADLPAGCW